MSSVVDPTLVFLSLGLQSPQEDEEDAGVDPDRAEVSLILDLLSSGEEEPLHRLDFLLLLVVLSFLAGLRGAFRTIGSGFSRQCGKL